MIKSYQILIFIMFLPVVSSISTNMLSSYSSGETMIIEIQGNILQPIERSDIIFKRAHVAVAVDYDIKKISGKYYLYAQLPLIQNNYTLFINNVATTINGQVSKVNFNQSFEVIGNLTDYSVNPGFVIASQNFILNIKSNLDDDLTIDLDFPNPRTISIKPGINNVEFLINSLNQGFYLAKIGKYLVPVQIINPLQENSSKNISLRVFPKLIRETIETNKEKTYKINISNLELEEIKNLDFIYNEEIFSLNKKTIPIAKNSSVELEVSLNKLDGQIIESIFITQGDTFIERIDFEINFTKNSSKITNSSKSQYYCSELNGKFCSKTEICSSKIIESLDGSCCTGECEIEKSSSTNWIVYLLIILFLIILFVIYMRYKKTKIPKLKNMPLNSVLKKPL